MVPVMIPLNRYEVEQRADGYMLTVSPAIARVLIEAIERQIAKAESLQLRDRISA